MTILLHQLESSIQTFLDKGSSKHLQEKATLLQNIPRHTRNLKSLKINQEMLFELKFYNNVRQGSLSDIIPPSSFISLQLKRLTSAHRQRVAPQPLFNLLLPSIHDPVLIKRLDVTRQCVKHILTHWDSIVVFAACLQHHPSMQPQFVLSRPLPHGRRWW